jgi:hypothetical protein
MIKSTIGRETPTVKNILDYFNINIIITTMISLKEKC